ncbi:MAG: hypothetical protein K2K64_11875 [Muribaculaceae bacterium]|nr:hypothetical protein [Muribaculaceae bacterium]
MKVSCAIFAIKMPNKNVLSLSKRGLALKVLSKLLYAIADNGRTHEELLHIHERLLNESLKVKELASDFGNDMFRMEEIPWERLLDTISKTNHTLKVLTNLNRFSIHEIRYMCALICGLSGKEYEHITGFKSHYNLSWSIRRKLGMPSKTTNLRNYLQKLSDYGLYESQKDNVQN